MKDAKLTWQVAPERELFPDEAQVYEDSFIELFTNRLHQEIDLALKFQLSLIHGRVIDEEYLRAYGVKEVHPNGVWLYKYHGMPLVEVTPPHFDLRDDYVNTTWKVRCLPIDELKAARIAQPSCWRH